MSAHFATSTTNSNTLKSEKLDGHIERVTFRSEETGFCVIKVKANGHRDLVTVVGVAASITEGEYVEAKGSWINDGKYGLQFKAESLRTLPPTTIEGLEKYLASGMVKGVGPHFARQLVQTFGKEVFEIIDNAPQRLMEVAGIGSKRKEIILASWAEQKAIRSIMMFLQAHGIGTARAVRIYKTYGDKAIDKVRENPYRLAQDIYGIGFKTADLLAQRLGIAQDSLIRARAGVNYALQELSSEGHCASLLAELIAHAAALLAIKEDVVTSAVDEELKAGNLVAEDGPEGSVIYLAAFYGAESGVAKNLLRLKNGVLPWGKIDVEKAIPWAEKNSRIQFSASQKNALAQILGNKVNVLTGGPGVGKTTIINSLIKIVSAKGVRVTLCAPTGRAAQRLSETTRREAKTIHRLLGFNAKGYYFTHDADNPLHTDFVIVDEASMIDIVLMQYLLRAIPDHCALLIVGDVDQLPSVGPGAVLLDIINSTVVSTARLTEIFRQAATSRIIINAHRLNQGEYPLYDKDSDALTDFYFISCETPEEIFQKLIHVVTKRIPEKFGFNPLRDIQVLSPMHRGMLGTRSLNLALQEALNKTSLPKIEKFGCTFAPRDKIIQNVNDYDKDVFNGDIGTITGIDPEESNMMVNFNGENKPYDYDELDTLSLAYAISIHKSQGSEYPVVVIPLSVQHYMMLARNLIYTAVTRGKKLVVLVGQPKALAIAIRNVKANARLTGLCKRLQRFLQ